MNQVPYSNREIDAMMESVHDKLDLILAQTTKTNGRVRLHDKILLVAGTAIFVLLIVNASPFVTFISAIIKP